MLWMITALLLILWLVGMVSGVAVGSWVHMLLVLAIIAVVIAIIRRGTSEVV